MVAMPFRFQARFGLLTYPQSGDLTGEQIVVHLGSLGAECIVGRESHADGGIHLHAFFMFERKFQSRNERIFDVGGHHPNIVPSRGTPEAGYDYATKDGDIVAGGLLRADCTERIPETSSKWAYFVLAETRDEFFSRIQAEDPRSLCTHFTSLCAYANWRYRPEVIPYRNPDGISFDTSEYAALDDWVRRSLGTNRSGKFFNMFLTRFLCGWRQDLATGGGAPSLAGGPSPHPNET